MLYFMNEKLSDHFMERLLCVPDEALQAPELQKRLSNPEFHEAIAEEIEAAKDYISKISDSFRRADLRLENVFTCTKLWLQARTRSAGRRTREGKHKVAYIEACISLVSEIREEIFEESRTFGSARVAAYA